VVHRVEHIKLPAGDGPQILWTRSSRTREATPLKTSSVPPSLNETINQRVPTRSSLGC